MGETVTVKGCEFYINYVECKSAINLLSKLLGFKFYINYVECKLTWLRTMGIDENSFILTMWNVNMSKVDEKVIINKVLY